MSVDSPHVRSVKAVVEGGALVAEGAAEEGNYTTDQLQFMMGLSLVVGFVFMLLIDQCSGGHAHSVPGTQRGHAHSVPGTQWGHAHSVPGTQRGHAHSVPGTQWGHAHLVPGTQWGHAHSVPGTQRGHAHSVPVTQWGHAHSVQIVLEAIGRLNTPSET